MGTLHLQPTLSPAHVTATPATASALAASGRTPERILSERIHRLTRVPPHSQAIDKAGDKYNEVKDNLSSKVDEIKNAKA